MKYVCCLLTVLLLFLYGCSEDLNRIEVETFSYAEDCAAYDEHPDAPWVKRSGFVNVGECRADGAAQAIRLAKNECTVEYDTISAAFDPVAGMYAIIFWTENQLGGDQTVYIDQKGITQLIVYGE